ncbi:MAG: M20 family metallopeptidase [Chloroflexi bacterium]|nr:M20 family metallopeptidase [Chloroflexota bacterium]
MMHDLYAYLNARTDEMVEMIIQLATVESPSNDAAAVNRCVDLLADILARQGASLTRLKAGSSGDNLAACFGGGPGQVLLVGHADTVWASGTLEHMPVHKEGDRLYGPGVYDMKGGLVMGIYAIKALQALGQKPPMSIEFLITSDEEIGSPNSRELIEERAKESKAAIVLEPAAMPSAAIKTSRKGLGFFQLKIRGKAAHAGVEPEKGISALEELAHQIIYLHGLTDYRVGTTVNVGVARGGTRSNVVAAEAEAEIDLRVATTEEGERLTYLIRHLQPHLQGIELEVTGGLNRPPFERTKGVVQLYQQAKALAAEIGIELAEMGTGGGSDGNFTMAVGTATLDGAGPVGEGAHAAHEHLLISHLAQRAAIVAGMMCQTGIG